MSSKVQNMTQGKPVKLLFTFALPLMAGNIFQQLYTVVDTMVVGQFLGVDALAALGATDWLNWMMLGIIQGFTQGFAIKMAQDFGAGDYVHLRKVIGNSAILSALFSIVLVIAGILAAKPVLNLLQTPGDIMPSSLLYIYIMFAGIPIVMFYNLLACILRSLGDSKTPLHAMIIASITNIVLDVLFVFGFKWGIAGAAIATLIAQVLSSVFCFWHIRKLDILRLSKSDFKLENRLFGHLLYLGSPMAFQNAIIAVGGMVVQFVVNGVGVIFIAGFTATNKLYGLLEIAATSYGYAIITYVGQNLGAGKKDRIKQGMRSALVIATMKIAYFYLAIMSVCLPVLYLLHVVRSAIQGIGNTFLPMLSGIAELLMRTGTALLLPKLIGETGIFYAEIAAWVGADIVLVISYLVIMRKLGISSPHKERVTE